MFSRQNGKGVQKEAAKDPYLQAVFGRKLEVFRGTVFVASGEKRGEVVASAKSARIVAEVDWLIEDVNNVFHPSQTLPSPQSVFSARRELFRVQDVSGELYDVAAVVSGQKPVAFVGQDIISSPHGRELLERALERHLVAVTPTSDLGTPCLLIGAEALVQKASEALEFRKRFSDSHGSWASSAHEREFEHQMGRSLGYPKEAVELYLQKYGLKNLTAGYVLEVLAKRTLTYLFGPAHAAIKKQIYKAVSVLGLSNRIDSDQ